MPKENSFKKNRAIWLLITLFFLTSCTYAPITTKIDTTYNARQMAVGMGDQSTGAMSSTIHEDESPTCNQDLQQTQATTNNQASNTSAGVPLARLEQMSQRRISGVDNSPKVATSNAPAPDYITIGSTKADVARIQGTPRRVVNSFNSIGVETWGYGGYDRIEFKNGRVNEWKNSSGFLKVKM